MSRILLVSLEADGAPRGALGPGLRARHFATALVRDGHRVDWLLACTGLAPERIEAVPRERTSEIDGAPVAVLEVGDRFVGGVGVARWLDKHRPDAVVGVTAFGASLALRLDLDVPLWADIFGDLMAEAQAKALVHRDDRTLAHFWSTLVPVLEHADRFSAVSSAQAAALVGQLGLVGRLGAFSAGDDLVATIPCAAEAPALAETPQRQAARRVFGFSDDAFVVLWSGSFNTWCDVETLIAGVERAMDRDTRMLFVTTGGAVAGHDERTYARFLESVARSRHRERMHVLGWVDGSTVEALTAAADVGVVVERDLYERMLGSENRIVWWMARGLACVTTARSELGRTLVADGLAFACAPAQPDSLADVLCSLANDRPRLETCAARCRRLAVERFSYTVTAAPLLEWARSPRRAADAGQPRALQVTLASDPEHMAPLLERYLAGLTLTQVFYRSVRWLGRRLLHASRRRRSATVQRTRRGPSADEPHLSIADVCE